ncbi:MAG TPA: cytochrome c biogenesis CcdA family protein [Rhodoglobus sp.]|nr:cytochrome c biogenesis CcdA family protein [Rhodoglobus sp.]
MDIGLVTAFLGGMLAILSPCGALLLPAFFASTVGAGPRLLLHGSIFYLGLLLVLVPLGVGAGAIGTLFLTHRALVIGIASGILVVFGLLQIFGIGFDPARLLPGGQALQQRASSSVGVIKTFLLGSASGIAGFCAGPILGAVLTLAAAQGDLFTAGALLAVYGAGMVVPLLIIAALWGKIGDQGRRRLRGRSFTVLGREFHTTSVITGVLITIVGVVFWATNGLIDMPSLIPTSVSAWVQGRSSILANGWVDLGVILAVAAIALLIWWRSARQKPVSAEPGEHETR